MLLKYSPLVFLAFLTSRLWQQIFDNLKVKKMLPTFRVSVQCCSELHTSVYYLTKYLFLIAKILLETKILRSLQNLLGNKYKDKATGIVFLKVSFVSQCRTEAFRY